MDYKKLISCLEAGISTELERELRLGEILPISRLQKLRAKYPDLPLNELLDQFSLQDKARHKFAGAEKMLFTAKGVEQSSSEVMAAYHNQRAGKIKTLADLCCGIGGDLQFLAENREQVYAVDLDADSLLCARYNNRKYNKISFRQERAESFDHQVDLIFADPDRRSDGVRRSDVEKMSPDLGQLLDLMLIRKLCKNMMIKLSPVIDYLRIEKHYFGENSRYSTPNYSWEFISESGVVKEILLILGEICGLDKRKAVILPSGIEISGSGEERIEIKGWQKYLYEPDKAVIRSGLVQKLGKELGYRLVDEHLALLSGSEPVSEKYGKLYSVKRIMPYKVKLIRKYLREQKVGELVLKTRGFPEPVEKLRQQFKLKGDQKMIMLVVRYGEGHQVVELEKV